VTYTGTLFPAGIQRKTGSRPPPGENLDPGNYLKIPPVPPFSKGGTLARSSSGFSWAFVTIGHGGSPERRRATHARPGR
jgi:hypothetical protein